jgi:hypothetical protein
MKRKIKGALMKRITALLSAIVLCQLLASCDSGWPYKPDQFVVSTPPPKSGFVSGSDVAAFCGTQKVTLFYSYYVSGTPNPASIYYVSLEDSNAEPVKLKRPTGAYQLWMASSPMPSPDGKLVAYYMYNPQKVTQAAAFIQKVDSTSDPVLIDDPGSDPHFYEDPQGNLFVTYADTSQILLEAELATYATNATYKVRVDTASGQPNVTSKVKIVNYPMYGGISQDGQFMCTGYSGAYIYSFADSTLHPIDHGLQTCNPSISTDSTATNKMMFLNFGGKQNLLNNPYPNGQVGEHLAVFVVDISNNVVDHFDLMTMLGAAKQEWQCPEWSNNPDYFAALATEDMKKYDVYVVRISTHTLLRLNNPANFRLNGSSTPYVFIAGGAS